MSSTGHSLRILLLSPLWHPASRDAAGGIETFLAELADGLVARGHRVSLLATGDSRTAAELLPVVPTGLVAEMTAGARFEYEYYEQLLLAAAVESAGDVDIVHSHIGPSGYVLSALPHLSGKTLHTLHTPVTPDLQEFVAARRDLYFTTVSDYQRHLLVEAGARSCRTVHNGLDLASFRFVSSPPANPCLSYLGRIEAVKGPHLAIDVAEQLGLPLTLAGPIIDGSYFARDVEPRLGEQVRYVGVLNRREKTRLLGESSCVVLPFLRPEPFGLVAIESMACGTPVSALACGALPEIVRSGVNGELAETAEGLVDATRAALGLDRDKVRTSVVDEFGLERMLDGYESAYRWLLGASEGSC